MFAAQWVHCEAYSPAPHGAILAGNDADGSPIFVGRAQHGSDHLVANGIPDKQIAYVSNNGQEILKYNFEVLCHESVQWLSEMLFLVVVQEMEKFYTLDVDVMLEL